jgi:hypothetical protein
MLICCGETLGQVRNSELWASEIASAEIDVSDLKTEDLYFTGFWIHGSNMCEFSHLVFQSGPNFKTMKGVQGLKILHASKLKSTIDYDKVRMIVISLFVPPCLKLFTCDCGTEDIMNITKDFMDDAKKTLLETMRTD